MGGTSAALYGRPLPSVHGRALGEEVALFLSTYVNKVDRKGRVSVPATFRATLATQRFPGVVVWPSYKFPALEACDIERMEELVDRQDLLTPYTDDFENFGALLADAQQLPFDSEGRIVLPEILAQHAAITENAAFVGQGRTFQIWAPERFEEHQAGLRERARRQGLRVPVPGQPRAPG
jgi:transcriptional regulator MraZ